MFASSAPFRESNFLLALGLAVLWSVDPASLGLDLDAAAKRIPSFGLAAGLVLGLLSGVKIIPFGRGAKRIFKEPSLIFLAAFGLFATCGSLYSKYVFGEVNTFLTMGVYTFVSIYAVWLYTSSPDADRFLRRAAYIYFVGAVLGVVAQAVAEAPGVYHGREHLVIGGLSLILLKSRSLGAVVLSLGVLIVVAADLQKNTGYLVVASVILLCGIPIVLRKTARMRSSSSLLLWGAVAGVGLLMAVAGAAYLSTAEDGPTGNVEFRNATYERAIGRFWTSPILGQAFTGAASEEFGLYEVFASTQVLPTHSDVLDVLAQGGVVGMFFWVMPFLFVGWRWLLRPKVARSTSYDDLSRIGVVTCIGISGLVVCAFNPVLNLPNAAFATWGAIGLASAALFSKDR